MWSSRKRLVLETKLQKPREDDSGGDHKGEWQREKRTHFTETQSDGLNALSSLLPLNMITLRTCLPSYNRQNLATLLCYLSICIRASLQDPPLRSSASYYLHLCVFPSHIESSSSLWPREDYQNDQVWFPRISPKRHCNFCFGLLTHSLSHHARRTHAALWRGPCGEELKHPSNSQHQLASHANEPPWKWIFNPSQTLRWFQSPCLQDLRLRSQAPWRRDKVSFLCPRLN